jgi:diguanylate cyclase (GGDEF)-like protein
MTIARKIAIIFVALSLILSGVIAGYVAQREYQVALERLTTTALAQVKNRPDLQLYFYQLDAYRLGLILGELLQSPSVFAAIAYSNLGDLLARRDLDNTPSRSIPSLQATRANISVTDSGLVAFDSETKESGTGFWSSVIKTDSTIYLSMPVFSSVNPVAKDLELSNFAEALAKPGANNSLVVIGYIDIAIDRRVLLLELRPRVIRAFLFSMALLSGCATFCYLISRRGLDSFKALKKTANDILSGTDPQKLEFNEDSEFGKIAEVLNSVLDNSASQKYEAGLDHKLALLKADDRASQLSLREQELSAASEEMNATKEQLHRLANYDHLTSLPNRQLFMEQLELLLRLCARDAKPLAVLFLNLDNFSRINESLGRNAGDLLLKEVGKRLAGCLRSSDIVAHYVSTNEGVSISRFGGDEFAFVLSQLDSIDAAGMIAQRVTDILAEPMLIDGHELVVSSSIGIAIAPRNGMDVEGLLRCASTAMQHAKSTSASNFLYYKEYMEPTDQDDLKIESELRKAIDRNELSLHYQPQIDTNNGSIICAEALLRWENSEFGSVSPARFIPLAEKMGLIWELGDWVLVEACRQMKAFEEQGLQLPRIAINISPQQFKPALITRVREVLNSVNLSPSMLELGLSEEILMDNDGEVLKFLQELKETGVYLSLENFGTNHAPISYLGRQPLDEIKIDRSFVLDCDTRKDAARLVKAIIAMAKSLNLHTVAEGVETAGQYRFLAANGVNIMRGYLFSKPVPAAELQKLLLVPWHFMPQLQKMALLGELKSPSRT